MLDLAKVFLGLRMRLFNGRLSQAQVDGMAAILTEWTRRGLTDLRWLAYMLATTYWETNQTMQPVREAYWLSEGWRRQNLRYWPWYGRGFVQLTWERNYRVMTQLLGIDLLTDPDVAMRLDVATQVLFEGMLRAESGVGDFTGHCLEMYFNDSVADWVGARKIINGTDKDDEIAAIAVEIHEILLGAPKE